MFLTFSLWIRRRRLRPPSFTILSLLSAEAERGPKATNGYPYIPEEKRREKRRGEERRRDENELHTTPFLSCAVVITGNCLSLARFVSFCFSFSKKRTLPYCLPVARKFSFPYIKRITRPRLRTRIKSKNQESKEQEQEQEQEQQPYSLKFQMSFIPYVYTIYICLYQLPPPVFFLTTPTDFLFSLSVAPPRSSPFPILNPIHPPFLFSLPERSITSSAPGRDGTWPASYLATYLGR